GAADQLFRRPVEDADGAIAVDADDSGAGAGQHRLGEAPTAVDEITCVHDVVALRAEFLCHAVERLTEMREIPFRLPYRHAHIKIACRDRVSRTDEAANRRDQAVRKIQPDPDR